MVENSKTNNELENKDHVQSTQSLSNENVEVVAETSNCSKDTSRDVNPWKINALEAENYGLRIFIVIFYFY